MPSGVYSRKKKMPGPEEVCECGAGPYAPASMGLHRKGNVHKARMANGAGRVATHLDTDVSLIESLSKRLIQLREEKRVLLNRITKDNQSLVDVGDLIRTTTESLVQAIERLTAEYPEVGVGSEE